MKKLVLFGAGKIGRSFIAQLFSRAGYETVFVDIDQNLIRLLNERKAYPVVIRDKQQEIIRVENVRAVHVSETDKVMEELAGAAIVATSVGQKGLPSLFPLLAEGLQLRRQKNELPLDILIAENIRNADLLFQRELKKYLPKNYPFEKLVGLVETSIGKMVPIMTAKDMEEDALQIFAEAYNTLPVDAKAFKNPVPDVQGLAPKQNMKAWVDRKSFIHNLGHAAAAYFGYLEHPEENLLWKVLADKKVYHKTRDTMLQSVGILAKKYPEEFTFTGLEAHTDDLLQRFQNRSLGDTVFRVGCDLHRKLDRNDRLAGAIHLAREEQLSYEKILEALVAGFYFRETDENGKLFPADRQFISDLEQSGFEKLFQKITGINNLLILEKARLIQQNITSSF